MLAFARLASKICSTVMMTSFFRLDGLRQFSKYDKVMSRLTA